MKKFIAGVLASLSMMVGVNATSNASTVSADVVFVIDSSGSMSGEFTFLSGAISDFLTNLQGAGIDAQAALVNYTNTGSLVSDLSSDASALSSAFSSVYVGGSRENGLTAMDAALPGGNTDLGISYRTGSVKTLVLITDEDLDDYYSYVNSFGNGIVGFNGLMDDVGFLLNIIYNFGAGDSQYSQIERPDGALFDIDAFRSDRQTFFDAFTQTKIQEIKDAAPVPLPAAAPLFAAGLGLAGFLRRRKVAA